MITGLSFHNLAVWVAQVFLITSVGALLPILLRIQHSRSKLVYYRFLLVAALLLPLIQPVQHEVVILRSTQQTSASPIAALTEVTIAADSIGWNLRDVAIGLLLAGFIVRIGWLTGGLWQIRRLRNSSAILHPLPPAVERARAITETDAVFCMSETIKGPVTFGFLRPVVLLPSSFFAMPDEAQLSVACHELLHVRRNDWLLTLAEELIASFLWFQPAVWWLVSESRLAREQLVDAGVVSLTDSRESYINTLFSLANAKWEEDLGVASLFLRRRQLTQRVHSLLMEVSMSRMRLLSSYCLMAVILAVAAAFMLVSIPLIGQAEIRLAPVEEPLRASQNSVGYVVNRIPLSYPVEAQQKRIEGTVVVEVTLNAAGGIVDSRVLSGPEELRQVALQTAIQGKYPTDSARTIQVVIDFKLPPQVEQRGARGQRGAAPQVGVTVSPANPDGPPQLSGSVADSSRNLLPGASVTLTNPETQAVVTSGLTDAKGEYNFSGIAPGTYTLSAQIPGFQTATYNKLPLGRSQQVRLNFTLGPEGASVPSIQDPPSPQRVRVGANVLAANLLVQVKPEYPAEAKAIRIQGVVVLEVNISKEGTVEPLTVVIGHPLLTQAAIDAVKQWVYKPTLLNGQPVDVVSTITVNFQLQD